MKRHPDFRRLEQVCEPGYRSLTMSQTKPLEPGRGGGVSVNFFIDGGIKPKACQPAGPGKGKKKQQWQQRPASSSITG
jgi:hypothetical protein